MMAARKNPSAEEGALAGYSEIHDLLADILLYIEDLYYEKYDAMGEV